MPPKRLGLEDWLGYEGLFVNLLDKLLFVAEVCLVGALHLDVVDGTALLHHLDLHLTMVLLLHLTIVIVCK